MGKTIITAKNAPAAIGPYCHGVKVQGLVFTSGQIPLDPSTGEIVGGGIEAQTEQVLQNLKAVLEAGGTNLGNVAKCTVFLTDLANFAVVNEIYGKYFASNPPARTCVEISALPKGSLVEIEAVAVCE